MNILRITQLTFKQQFIHHSTNYLSIGAFTSEQKQQKPPQQKPPQELPETIQLKVSKRRFHFFLSMTLAIFGAFGVVSKQYQKNDHNPVKINEMDTLLDQINVVVGQIKKQDRQLSNEIKQQQQQYLMIGEKENKIQQKKENEN